MKNTSTPNLLLCHSEDVRRNYFRPHAVEQLGRLGNLRMNDTGEELSLDKLIEAARGCEVIIAYRETPAEARLFESLPDLKAYVRCAVDIRNIDLGAASRAGVLVTHVSGVFVSGVAEWTIAAMIDLGRNLSGSIASYRAGRVPIASMGTELRGATLGIIGYGRISRYLCDLALAFGMRVLVCDPYSTVSHSSVQQLDLPGLLSESDFVVCLAVANTETENLMNADAFSRMKTSAFFVNPSRGNLVDERALLEALDAGRLAGCALDVGRELDQMPSLTLTSHPRVIATPHVAGLTPALDAQSMEAIAQTAQILKGEIPQGALNAGSAIRLKEAL